MLCRVHLETTLGLCPWPVKFQLGAPRSAWVHPGAWYLPQDFFATVTLTSSAWSFPFLRGNRDLWLFVALFFYKPFWGLK